jgi:hypothetical protein
VEDEPVLRRVALRFEGAKERLFGAENLHSRRGVLGCCSGFSVSFCTFVLAKQAQQVNRVLPRFVSENACEKEALALLYY